MPTNVHNITYICIRGGNSVVKPLADRSQWEYGARDNYTLYGAPYMLDYDFEKPHNPRRWKRYLGLLESHDVVQGVAMDYMKPSQAKSMSKRAEHLAQRGVTPVIVPKFDGAVRDIPILFYDHARELRRYVVVGISVPTDYAGFLPQADEVAGRYLHLLGGHPDQWRFLIDYYKESTVISIDGNAFFRQAGYGKFWSRNGGYIQTPTRKYSDNALIVASMRNTQRYIESGKQPGLTDKRIVDCRRALGMISVQLPLFKLSA